MEIRRSVLKREQKRNKFGKKLCLVCESDLPKRRSSYCSDECWVRNTPRLIRADVERRDKGVCALCSTQCQTLYMPWESRSKYPTWEADHIVPVCKGGGLCGIDGYRTLCIDCHKKQTKQLNQSRKKPRRAK